MIKNRAILKLKNVVHSLELVLCVLIALGIILCFPDLFKYFYLMVTSGPHETFELFRMFLKHVLTLVVGVEFIIMLITRANESILSLVLFVIARKMLVYSETMVDLILGTVSVAVVFMVMKFLVDAESPHVEGDNIYSAALPVDRINRVRGYDLPTTASMTLGGLVYMQCKSEDCQIAEGLEFHVDGYRLTITKCNEGVIEKVQIEPLA